MENKDAFISNLTFKVALNITSHPFEYAKVLIQIGHEPLSPYPTTTMLGKPVIGLPNIFKYVKHIKEVDGFAKCYRGLSSRLLGNSLNLVTNRVVSSYAEQYAFQLFPPSSAAYRNSENEDEKYNKKNSKEKWLQLWRSTFVEIAGKTAGVIVSHPFQVITIRMMAQFVGGETQYDGILSSIGEIYKTNGILGFFAGLVPRLLAELLLTLLINVSIFLAESYFKEPEVLKYSSVPVAVIGSTFTYHLHLISTCMAVNNSGLAAGYPPLMPYYTSWVDCWKHLYRTDQLNRGASLFFRYYKGSYITPTSYRNFVVKTD